MLRLPKCQSCGKVQYPVRELCGDCLADTLEWTEVEPSGSIVSWTRLHVSGESFFNEHGPWSIGLVKLDCGPVVFAHLTALSPATGQNVRLEERKDRFGRSVLVAMPEDGSEELTRSSNLFIEEKGNDPS